MQMNRTPMELLDGLLRYFRNPTPEHSGPAPWYLDVARDLRDTPRPAGSRARIVRVRKATSIVGITLHQTATRDFHHVYQVPAHAMVHRDGRVSLLHHPTAYVYHGHALNGGTIGIEIACRAAGTEGDPSTFWRSARERNGYRDERGRWHPPRDYAELVCEATDIQLAATRDLVRYYCELVPSVRALWAHRQGRDDRTSDPGSRIWRNVAEPLREELELVDVRDMVLGDGMPIPESWRVQPPPPAPIWGPT
jgi:hypothetical protein